MKRIAVIVVSVFAVAILSCGNDPRVIDAPPTGTDGSGSSCEMTTAYLQDCDTSATCMGCRCQLFGHAMYCSKPCSGSADCPAPSMGCAFNGYCMR